MEKIKSESQSLIFSILLHSSFLLFFITQKNFTPDLKPLEIEQTLRVDLVGLPDLSKMEMPESLKKSAPSQQIDEKITPSESLPIEKSEMSINDKKILPKKIEKPIEKQKDQKHQIANALNRLKSIEGLKKEEAEENEAQNEILIKGNRLSKGSSLSGAAREALEVSYYERIKDALNDNWALPPWLAKLPLSAQVLIQIDSEGRLQNLRFLKPSGNTQFDQMVKTTINETVPFPHPPKNLLNQILEKGIVLGFPL